MITALKPMLGCNDNVDIKDIPDLLAAHGTLYVTPKYDGIRVKIVGRKHNGVAYEEIIGVSRTNEEIPNAIFQDWVSECPTLQYEEEGELWIPGRTFNEIQSWVMTAYTPPAPFIMVSFDWQPQLDKDKKLTYLQRLQKLKAKYRFDPHRRLCLPGECRTVEQVTQEFNKAINEGLEGLVIRTNSPYKYGRSTWDEGYFLKMKKLAQKEAVILDIIEAQENQNEKKQDAFGHAKRSKHKANLKGKGYAGAILCRDILSGIEFKLGSGFDRALAQDMYDNPEDYINEICTYQCHNHGVKTKPRNASFKSMRKLS